MEQYNFSNRNINLVCEEVGEFLDKYEVEQREALRTKLTVEEVLLNYQEKFGEEATFKLKYAKRFSSIKIEIIVAGESFDPLSQKSDETDVIQFLLSQIDLAPTWGYKNGKNSIVFISKKKPLSDAVKMVGSIILAVICGLLLNALPNPIRIGINEYFLTPVTDAIMGLINAVSGPLIFLSVLSSILSMGNMETLGKIGSKTIKILLLYMTVIGIAMTAIGSLFFKVKLIGNTASSFSQVLDLIYDIIPTNLFEPFLTGNALQLIFISVMVGLAMLLLSSKVNGIFSLVEQLSAIMNTIMSGLSSILPFLIFVLFTGMISGGSFSEILGSWKMILLIVLLCVLYYTSTLLWIAFRKKVSPVLLLKKAWPTLVIALTTASSAAAFNTNVNDANMELGIDRKLVEFGIPIGQVLFMPGLFATLFVVETCLAESCGIAITVPWLIISFVTNYLVSTACPPVPGTGMMCFSVAFAQLCIPVEMMGIALAIDMITDFPTTAATVSGWQLTLIDVADSLDMLNKEILREKI